MKEATIEELAYIIKGTKDNNQPKPIFFLGAGASRSGEIPLAAEIVEDILLENKDNPKIKILNKEDKSYAKLMECLQPYQRDKLLKKYIENAKINVTHIYLAQLIQHGYADYVLTVNFDNLMLRALALFNEFPSTYDMAILKDLTTTKFKEKSVVYLHGQHHGLWLLNTEEEMDKVQATVPRIFDSIKDRRPWIFVGYSANDPIFNHIVNLGRFDNGLYWVTYENNDPNENVMSFLRKPNTNAEIIKGYDSDSFFIKLNNELKINQPLIIDKPFSSVKGMLNNIVDIENKEHFKGVKERLLISKKQVDLAITQYEEGISLEANTNSISEIDILKKSIIDLIVKEKFSDEDIVKIISKVEELNNNELRTSLANYYSSWGSYIGNNARLLDKIDLELYEQGLSKFDKALELDKKYYYALNDWCIYYSDLIDIKNAKDTDEKYKKIFSKFKQACEINIKYYNGLINWSHYLRIYANLKSESEAEKLYLESIEKSKEAIRINKKDYKAYLEWGSALFDYTKNQTGQKLKDIFDSSIEKLKLANKLKPNDHYILSNIGDAYLFYSREIKNENSKKMLSKAIDFLKMSYDNGGRCYNLSCIYSNINDKINAMFYLRMSLERDEINISFVLADDDWKLFIEDNDFQKLVRKYKLE